MVKHESDIKERNDKMATGVEAVGSDDNSKKSNPYERWNQAIDKFNDKQKIDAAASGGGYVANSIFGNGFA